MTERLVLAIAILGGLVVVGIVARAVSARRRARIVGSVGVDASPAGASRIIAFSGPGCAACATQRRILDALRAEWNGAVEVAYVDAVAEANLARRFGVVVVPTTVVAAPDGRIVAVNNGLADAERLRTQFAA